MNIQQRIHLQQFRKNKKLIYNFINKTPYRVVLARKRPFSIYSPLRLRKESDNNTWWIEQEEQQVNNLRDATYDYVRNTGEEGEDIIQGARTSDEQYSRYEQLEQEQEDDINRLVSRLSNLDARIPGALAATEALSTDIVSSTEEFLRQLRDLRAECDRDNPPHSESNSPEPANNYNNENSGNTQTSDTTETANTGDSNSNNNTGSLLDDYADTSTELPDYSGGDD